MKHSHRKRHSAFKTKVGLTTAILLTLSGPMAAQAAEKTYDSISRWGAAEATEGDPITVNEVNGWGSSANDPVHLTVGTKETKNVTIHNYSAGEGSTTEVHGQNISFGGKYMGKIDDKPMEIDGNFWVSKGQIAIGDEDTKTISMTHLRGDDRAEITVNGGTDSLDIGELSVGTATARIGGANTGKVTVDSIGLWRGYNGPASAPYDVGADVVIDGTQGITVNKAISVTSNSKLQLGTENNKGDVQIGSQLNWQQLPYSISVDNGSTVSVTAGGKISAAGYIAAVNGNSAIAMQGADIDIGGRAMATGGPQKGEKAPQISLTAEDGNGKRGNVNVQGLDVDNKGSITVKGDVVTIDDRKEKQQQNYSIHSANGSTVSINSNVLTMNKGVAFQGGGEMMLKGDKIVSIGSSVQWPYWSLDMTGGNLYVGGKEAETVLNGSVSMIAEYGKESTATIDGDKITINATITPDKFQNGSDRNQSLAIYDQDTDLTIGNDGTSSTVINGNLEFSGNKAVMYGNEITINGLRGKEEWSHPAAIKTDQPVQMSIGQAGTQQTNIIGYLDFMPENDYKNVQGNEIAIAGQNVILDNAGYDVMYAGNSKDVRIGSDFAGNTSENTVLKGTVKVSGLTKDGHLGIHGKHIVLSDGASEQDNYTTDIERDVTDSHDAFIALNGGDNPFTIGDEDSNVSIDGRLLSMNGDIDVNGKNIHIYEGTNKKQYVVLTHTNRINLGGDTTENLQIDGGFLARGGNDNGSALKGKNIVINAADGHDALLSWSQKILVGSNATDYLGINGEVFSHGSAAPISMQGKNVVITGKGEDEALLYTTGGQLDVDGDVIAIDGTQTKYAAEVNGGSMTIGHDGTHGMIKGDLENYGSMKIFLNGADSVMNGNIEDWCLEHPEGGEMGGVVLNLKDGAQWQFDGDSTVNTLDAVKGQIRFDPSSTNQKLTTHLFNGDGAVVAINSTGNSRNNDRLYVIGSHTGRTALQLHSLNNGKWSDGALGSILASVGEEKGSFYVPDTEDRLFFHHTELGRYETSKGDKVTPRYNTDWYLKGFTKSETDDDGHHTHVVRELAGLHNVNYQIWRDEDDTLFKRMGDLHTQDADHPEGVWARSLGTSDERRSGEFSSKTRFHEYQTGYDVLRGSSQNERHYQGVGLSYTQGKGSYLGGYSDVTGWGLGLYDTRVKSDGQYLDFALRGTHLEGELHGAYSHGDNLDNNGYTFGVEYGWKHPFTPNKQGWFVEPQAQLTFGWLDGADLTLANGVHYHENNIKSAVGRAGLRVGYEGQQAQFFAKADWFHEFGGSSQLYLSDDEGQLHLDEDYGDTWFAYGLGLTANLTKNSQLYADIEKSNSGTYHEKWCWDVGVRWTF
ncbi:autotransporter outer membrane beta-barrel domain-containing protein [uncultured Mitsuokella sp.]|uniref:autotransporter outer membrane beta-barrel domain-containing protein n=1 Tax=uncultured Mitsuokella sp. TaxID=453120 RepID=UPI00266FE8DA|nr:autotransporter outer membrane beta-barrel domain-containing protein [uncultured Mitsuokella sp.]